MACTEWRALTDQAWRVTMLEGGCSTHQPPHPRTGNLCTAAGSKTATCPSPSSTNLADGFSARTCMSVVVCVHARMCACVGACVCVCVRVYVSVSVSISVSGVCAFSCVCLRARARSYGLAFRCSVPRCCGRRGCCAGANTVSPHQHVPSPRLLQGPLVLRRRCLARQHGTVQIRPPKVRSFVWHRGRHLTFTTTCMHVGWLNKLCASLRTYV